MKQTSVFVGLAILAGLGISAAVVRPSMHGRVSANTVPVAGPEQSVAPLSGLAGSCAAPRQTGFTEERLTEESLAARTLLSQRQFSAALPRLQAVADADPGFPGIQLDIANALLQTGQPTAAKEAAGRQIAISECIAKLPPKALDSYCSEEFPHAFGDRCATQLTYIWHSAQLQSALVDLELAHSIEPHATPGAQTGSLAAAPAPEPLRAHPRHEGREHEFSPPAEHRAGDHTLLQDGDGTDSALGAYSKQ